MYDPLDEAERRIFLVHKEKLYECKDRRETMSWKTINAILALAAVDETFCQELLKDPVPAIQVQNFDLTAKEQEKIKRISAKDLTEFSQEVLRVFSRVSD